MIQAHGINMVNKVESLFQDAIEGHRSYLVANPPSYDLNKQGTEYQTVEPICYI
jgi:hypothetical protein